MKELKIEIGSLIRIENQSFGIVLKIKKHSLEYSFPYSLLIHFSKSNTISWWRFINWDEVFVILPPTMSSRVS